MNDPILHLAEPGDWARSTDAYRAPSLEEEGFIHCSTADQLPVVARDLFSGHNGLVLLTIDPEGLDDQTLVYEDLYGLGEEFPHVYGPLPTSAVMTTGPYLAHLEEELWLDSRWDRTWIDRVLHPEFTEVSRSGRTHSKDDILDAATEEFDIELPHEGYRLDLIDEDVALARYISRATYNGVVLAAHRTSVWVNTNDGWRLRFHQGTALP